MITFKNEISYSNIKTIESTVEEVYGFMFDNEITGEISANNNGINIYIYSFKDFASIRNEVDTIESDIDKYVTWFTYQGDEVWISHEWEHVQITVRLKVDEFLEYSPGCRIIDVTETKTKVVCGV